ncbi:MAG: GNAT family N-acetyltransferase [Bacteroidota bacterium]
MKFNFQPTLEDDLVILTPLQEDNFTALFNVASDQLLWEQHPAKQRSTFDGFTEFFNECLASGGSLLITDKKTGDVIGHSRYNTTEGMPNAIEIGWTYLARQCWGGKYNRAIKYLMLDHAFGSFDIVLFYVDKDNFRSQKAVEKIGGIRIEHPESESIPVKSSRNVIFRIRKQEWYSNPLNRRNNPVT